MGLRLELDRHVPMRHLLVMATKEAKMTVGKIAALIVLAAVLLGGTLIAADEFRIMRAKQVVDQLLTVDGLTPEQQAEMARKAGNSRYYSNSEIEAYIAANKPDQKSQKK